MRALALLLLMALPAAAQPGLLPVRTYGEIKSFRGGPEALVLQAGGANYYLYSAHKEGGRAWADAVFVRRTPESLTYLSRAYDCAQGTWRWMGEHADITKISQSVASIRQVQPRGVVPGTVEYTLARYVCAL